MKMRHYFGYISLVIVILLGLGLVLREAFKPSPITVFAARSFADTKSAARLLVQEMKPSLHENKILFFGLEGGRPEQVQLLFDFMKLMQESKDNSDRYAAFILDTSWDVTIPELAQIEGERLNFKTDSDRLMQGLQNAVDRKVRVFVIAPASQMASFLEDGVAYKAAQKEIFFTSLILASFPRVREEEKNMVTPCNVAEHDQAGTGKLGCEIVQTARSLYRDKFKSGEWVGTLRQLSSRDHLFMMTKEP